MLVYWCLFLDFAPVAENQLLVKTVAAKEQVVYVTKTKKKYHKGSCRYLKKSKIKTSKSKAKAKAKESGYTACKVCKP